MDPLALIAAQLKEIDARLQVIESRLGLDGTRPAAEPDASAEATRAQT